MCITSPSVASSFGSYAVTRWETQKCSDLWVLLETGKVVDRSPARGEYVFAIEEGMVGTTFVETRQLSSKLNCPNNVSLRLSFSV